MEEKNNLRKNFIWNVIGTTFNAFNSLFFMIIVTRINGINDAGIFTFAFSTACLFYVIGVYSGRTYQVTDEGEHNDSTYFYSKIITCVIMMISVFAFCFVRQYNLFKFTIIILLCLYKMIEALSETFYAIIQKENKLYVVGRSMFYKAIISLLLFLLIDYITNNLIFACSCILIVNILIVLVYDILALKKLKFKLVKIERKNVFDILVKGFFAFGFTFLTLYVINASKYSVDMYMNDSAQTVLGIIIMPATVISLFCQFIVQPFIVKMKKSLQDGKKEFLIITHKIISGVVVIGGISTICAYLLGIPMLEVLYNISLDKYKNCLLLIIIGATIYGITIIYSTALITMRKTFCQFIIFIITSIFAMIVSSVLTQKYGIYGACESYTVTMIFLLVLYVIVYLYQIRKKWKNEKE